MKTVKQTSPFLAILIIGAVMMFGAPKELAAAPVTLKANDGSVEIIGDLISFEDGFYLIRTSLGDMRISAARMSCEGEGCPVIGTADADTHISGSGAIGEGLMPLLLTGFAEFKGGEAEAETGNDPAEVIFRLTADGGFGDPMGSFLVTSNNSTTGFADLLEKKSELAVSTRRITPDEARALRASGAGNMIDFAQEHVIAVDSMLIIVNSENPVSEIKMNDLARVYLGEITNWSELGGPSLPINIYAFGDSEGAAEFFDGYVLQGRQASDVSWTLAAADEDMARAVNEDPNAIGYVGHAFQRGAKVLNVISECGIRSEGDTFSAKTEDYPLERRIYLYSREDTVTPEVKEFLDFARSEAADALIAKSGFIDLSVARMAQDRTEGRMRDIIEDTNDAYELGLMRDLLVEMLQWDRLSSTFRFGTGSINLDAKGALDLERLINYLENMPAGTKVATVGFTDSEGAFDGNRNVSLIRANFVMEAIREHGAGRIDHIELSAQGYGELSPAACNETPEGKRVNRRVEVWIRG